MATVMEVVVLLATAVLLLFPAGGKAVDVHQLRMVAAKNNVSCILVFGDSSVDPGNNNLLKDAPKGNFPPYGEDFFHGQPTGRFTNGRLATDFIAEALGLTNIIQAFLDPNITKENILHGISFASGGSGYDDLTANLSNVLSVTRQLEYMKHYKIRLGNLVGKKKAEEIIRNAVFLLSMGTNDFLVNYYVEPIRSNQFTIDKYQDFLISRMFETIKEMHRLGARRLALVGVPPFGCMPLVKTLRNVEHCDETLNNVASSFNSKIKNRLRTLRTTMGIKNVYADIYTIILSAVQNPQKYGFTQTSKGCCGTGTVETGNTCKGMRTCTDRTKYVFWDAVHPTEKMYRLIADNFLKSISTDVLN